MVPTIIEESQLYSYWQYFCNSKQFLQPEKLRGLFPGQLNKYEGPDFQGAEFEINGKIYRGDIEIHRTTAEWFAHGHHLDNRYDRVVLHVVWQDSPRQVLNSKKQSIKSISLRNMNLPDNLDLINQTCHLKIEDELKLEEQIKMLAVQRLTAKGREINKRFASCGADQGLYELLLQALGYVQNRENYLRIAALVPWDFIRYKKQKFYPPREYWLALFLGTAGFANEIGNNKVEKLWRHIYPEVKGNTLKMEYWKSGGRRPNNHPIKRLTGLAEFIFALSDTSFYNTLQNIFYERLSYDDHFKKLINLLSPTQFFSPENLINSTHRNWGKTMMTEIIGNVFLPIFYFKAINSKSYGFAAYLEQFYFYLPALSQYGKLQSLKKTLLNNSKQKINYYTNQALLQLQSDFCYLGKCVTCPLKGFSQFN